MIGPQPPVTSVPQRFRDAPERTMTLEPRINQPTAVQTMMEPMARSRGNVMIGEPFFCGVFASWREFGGVSDALSSGARAIFRCGSVSLSSFVRLRFLVENFGARPLVFAK